MTEKRIILEMGMGNNLHRQDYQRAAERAIGDALRHSTLALFTPLGLSTQDMRVEVTIGVQEPARIDTDALVQYLPRGRAHIKAVKGGQNVTNPNTGEVHVIATAVIEAFVPDQSGQWQLSK